MLYQHSNHSDSNQFSKMAYKYEKWGREERSKEKEEFLFPFSIAICWQI